MILSGIIAAAGKRSRPPAPHRRPRRFTTPGRAQRRRHAGSTHNFQASNILAQRYTTGVAGRIVSLFACFHGTGTPSFRISLYADSESLPGDLLAVVEGQAPGIQGWHELALDPARYLYVSETISAQSLFC
jgi:hypothetical protein